VKVCRAQDSNRFMGVSMHGASDVKPRERKAALRDRMRLVLRVELV
jgi:hypothetical protein